MVSSLFDAFNTLLSSFCSNIVGPLTYYDMRLFLLGMKTLTGDFFFMGGRTADVDGLLLSRGILYLDGDGVPPVWPQVLPESSTSTDGIGTSSALRFRPVDFEPAGVAVGALMLLDFDMR